MAGKTPPATFQNHSLEQWSSLIILSRILDPDCPTQSVVDIQVFSTTENKTYHTPLNKMYSLTVFLTLCLVASLRYIFNQPAALPFEVPLSGRAIRAQSAMGGKGWQWTDVRFRCSLKTDLYSVVSDRLNVTPCLRPTNQNVNFFKNW